jgi:hypothetical protein
MSDDLATLESQRSELMEEFLRLGDLRPRLHHCRDPTSRQAFCHCAKHDDPGPDPRFRLTRRVSGKTVTETFPNPTALHKAQQDSACRWRRLSGMLI